MIRGLLALFSSGLIFAPQVLAGIILGLFLGAKLPLEQIKSIYCNQNFYICVFFFIGLYVFIFKRTYKNSRGDIDWQDNLLRIFGYCAMFFISNIMAISFVYMLFV